MVGPNWPRFSGRQVKVGSLERQRLTLKVVPAAKKGSADGETRLGEEMRVVVGGDCVAKFAG